MYRFLALITVRRTDESATKTRALMQRLESASTPWQCISRTDRLSIFHSSANEAKCRRAYELGTAGSVVLGTLFDQQDLANPAGPVSIISQADREEICRSAGRSLIDRFWGHYVAFVDDAANETIHILRDPSAGIKCFIATLPGIYVAFSDFTDFLAIADSEKFTVNWSHIAHYLCYSRLVVPETGLHEVSQLRGGESIAISAQRHMRQFYWNPVDTSASGVVEDPRAAANALKQTMISCVGSWARCFDRILHHLSGGLDSTVVLHCLHESPHAPDVLCLNLRTRDAEGDERSFARQAAKMTDSELVEAEFLSPSDSWNRIIDNTTLVTPAMGLPRSESNDIAARWAAKYAAEAIFSGQGGDHLFQRRRDSSISAEFVARHGIRRRLLHVALANSRMSGDSVWSILRSAIAYGLFHIPYDLYVAFKPPVFMAREISSEVSIKTIMHPWVERAILRRSPKLQQIYDLTDCQFFYSFGDYINAVTIHPLISQPLIECALRIPSYVLTTGGTERALIREAFRDVIPADIVNRTSKGGTTGYYNHMLVSNLPQIRDLLLDGVLVQENILDRTELERSLSEEALLRENLINSILTSIRAEVWARLWTHSRSAAAV